MSVHPNTIRTIAKFFDPLCFETGMCNLCYFNTYFKPMRDLSERAKYNLLTKQKCDACGHIRLLKYFDTNSTVCVHCKNSINV